MQTTPLIIIKRALRLIGVLPGGDEPTSDQLADAFSVFQTMLDAWAAESLFSSSVTKSTYAVSSGAGQVSMGASGNITTRPNKVEYVYWGDKKLTLLNTRQEFDDQLQGTSAGTPEYAFYDRTAPLSYVRLCPANDSGETITVGFRAMVGVPATTADVMELLDGYKRAMEFNLAVDMAPEFEVVPPQWVHDSAISSKAAIKSANINVAQLAMPEYIGQIGDQRFDIRNG